DAHRPPLPGGIPGQRRGDQYRRLPRGLCHPARGRNVQTPGGAPADLVAPGGQQGTGAAASSYVGDRDVLVPVLETSALRHRRPVAVESDLCLKPEQLPSTTSVGPLPGGLRGSCQRARWPTGSCRGSAVQAERLARASWLKANLLPSAVART